MKNFHTCHQKSRSDGDGLRGFTIELKMAEKIRLSIKQCLLGIAWRYTELSVAKTQIQLSIVKNNCKTYEYKRHRPAPRPWAVFSRAAPRAAPRAPFLVKICYFSPLVRPLVWHIW